MNQIQQMTDKIKELHKAQQQAAQEQGPTSTTGFMAGGVNGQFWPYGQCPTCGKCPTCGRPGYTQPQYYSRPYYYGGIGSAVN